jgi:hypothetical protein
MRVRAARHGRTSPAVERRRAPSGASRPKQVQRRRDHGLEIDAPPSEWAVAREGADRVLAIPAASLAAVERVRLEGTVLHLVDVENLNGGPLQGRQDVLRTQLHYEQHVWLGHRHTLALASDASTVESIKRHWPADVHLAGVGADGADAALVDFASRQSIHRFDTVVIGSGDHCFADLAQHCTEAGLSVVVVAPALGLSRRLEAFADRVVLLPDRFGLAA